jgi:predicted kinase/predicted HD phosphohydrolase
MTVGLPASSKSTIAEEYSKTYNATIHSSDAIRKELFDDENYQEDNEQVFKTLTDRIKNDLRNNKNTIYDATNISYKRRMAFLTSLNKIDCYKICLFVATPYEKCLENNRNRERKIPDYVITNMYKNIYIPQNYEGWDDIVLVDNFDKSKYDLHDLFNGENGLNFISQDNPNHTLTIGHHCLKCASELELISPNLSYELYQAALLHDIGKRFTKEFKNIKGEVTDIAYYYQHHLVSAYDSLFYSTESMRLKIANYIQWHMQPFFMETEKTKEKYRKLWGDQFYKEIMSLHEADKRAH